jgi:hypothetical protein
MEKQRYFIDTHGPDMQACKDGIAKGIELALSDSELDRVILLIPSKSNTQMLEDLFSKEAVKVMFRGTGIDGHSETIKIESVRTFNKYRPSVVVVALHIRNEDLNKVDDSYSAKVIIAIPWVKGELDDWIRTWTPVELHGKTVEVEPYSGPSWIVIKALESLTHGINMSTGISHPSDNQKAKTIALALHKYETSLHPTEIKSYLVGKLNWTQDNASKFTNLIQTLNDGRYFKGGRRTGLREIYKQWKLECEEDDD